MFLFEKLVHKNSFKEYRAYIQGFGFSHYSYQKENILGLLF